MSKLKSAVVAIIIGGIVGALAMLWFLGYFEGHRPVETTEERDTIPGVMSPGNRG